MRTLFFLLPLSLLAGACSPAMSSDAGADAAPEASADAASEASPDVATSQAVTVRFRAVVGMEAFSCTRTFAGLGTTGTTWTPLDFRLYVHNVRLVTAAGAEVPVQLDADGQWQSADVALLDFEDRTGTCTGTAGTHTSLAGRVAPGSYTGLRFSVGVPFALDHLDATTADPPLDVSGMFWSWAAGYRFLRIEGNSTGFRGFNIHVGSSGCRADATGRVTAPCAAPNVAEVNLPGFDAATNTVLVDLGALTAGSNLDANSTGTAPGCMSDATDPECAPLLSRLGLVPGGSQSLFRLQ